MKVFPLLVLFALALTRCESLSCMQCQPEKCGRLGYCHWGIAKDVCGCCDVCAKGWYEKCGGTWDLDGICGDGLACFPRSYSTHGVCVIQYLANILEKIWDTHCKLMQKG